MKQKQCFFLCKTNQFLIGDSYNFVSVLFKLNLKVDGNHFYVILMKYYRINFLFVHLLFVFA